jgi:hypothetical protein
MKVHHRRSVCTHTTGYMACFRVQLASSSSNGQDHWGMTNRIILYTELASSTHGRNFQMQQPFWQNFTNGRQGTGHMNTRARIERP